MRPWLAGATAALFLVPSTALTSAAEEPASITEASVLRHRGIAELENERPVEAETIFRRLLELDGGEPLAHANLAVALLRQNRLEEALAAVERALQAAEPDDARRSAMLWIRSEVHLARDDVPGALADLGEAARRTPRDVEIQFALARLASLHEGESLGLRSVLERTYERLRELRPENAVVLLELGRRAIEAGDRRGATGAYLRLREILAGQGLEVAEELLGEALEALAAGSSRAAGVAARRLENVLKATPLYQGSLGELRTAILGRPLTRLTDEPPPRAFGEPLPVRFDGRALDASPTLGRALETADFDDDQVPDLARLVAGQPSRLEIRLGRDTWEPRTLPAPEGLVGLRALDLENAGRLDLIAFGPGGWALWRGGGDGTFAAAELPPGLGSVGGWALAVFDFDIEGDLDLVLASAGGPRLWRNAVVRFDAARLPEVSPEITELTASDLDRDGDLDLLLAHAGGLIWLDNLRQGRFRDRTAESGLPSGGRAVRAVTSADLDRDGQFDLVAAGAELTFWKGNGDHFDAWRAAHNLPDFERLDTVRVFEADNDGRLDLAAAGPAGVLLLGQDAEGRFTPLLSRNLPSQVTALVAADLDVDGDLDLVAGGAEGLHWLKNRGGNRNASLQVRLRGLVEGNSKNNRFGLGATVELLAGDAYQLHEVREPVTHLGLGSLEEADLLRIVWTNGVPENRFQPKRSESIVEEQSLKGSCPFLFTWNGEGFAFVTDLLWGAPIGMPLAPGVWAQPEPKELVKVEGAAVTDAGRWELRLTEELWEAAYFDHVRLWVVDHPSEVEVASNLRILPGGSRAPAVTASQGLRPVAAAWDGRGTDVTERVARRDEVYADGYRPSPYQGVAAAPWTFTFDLGTAPAAAVRLHLDGWIFPSDASLNLALAQRGDLELVPPRLEIEDGDAWRTVKEHIGLPPGKTKTLVVDTPPLPPNVRRLRIVTSYWLSWDRIAWTAEGPSDAARIVARLAPERAELRFRGFSERYREAPNAPHAYDYARVSRDPPWLPLPGRYTRYGEVRELLAESDSRSVILAAGDELALSFVAAGLPPLPAGFRRTLFLESHGWDKDADRNTWQGHRVEPLPFHGMSGYPGTAGETFPAALDGYRQRWLTREVEARDAP